jgi:hypothetical protein
MLRSYDPQIGRFLQHDPYGQFASGYVGMGNDPGNNVDEDGGLSGPVKPMTFGQIFVDNATWANSAPSLMDVVVTPTVVELAASAARTAAKSSFVAGAIDATKNMVIGLARMSNIFTMVSDQVNSAATTAEALRAGDYKKALQNEPTGFYNLGVNAVEAFKGNGYAQGTLAVNVVAALAIKKVAPRPVAAGSSSKVARVPAGNASNAGSGVVKTTTERLQSYVSQASKEVDALGDAAFTPKQLQAIQRNPNLRAMYRGNRIDVRARQLIKNDPVLSPLKSNYTRGADFVDPATGNWWDMTTSGSWPAHVNKYGSGGTLLRTQ